MTKQDYLKELKNGLRNYPSGFQKDILDAFEEHFANGLAAGQTEEEITENLGSITEVLANIREMEATPVNLVDLKAADKEKAPDPEPTAEKSRYFTDEEKDQLKNDLSDLSKAISDTISGVLGSMKGSFSEAGEGPEAPLQEIADAAGADSLALRGRNASIDVRLLPGSRLGYQYRPGKALFSDTAARLEESREGNTIVFTAQVPGNANLALCAGKLTIYVPETIRAVAAEVTSGDVLARGLALDSFRISTVSGDLSLDGLKSAETRISTTHGDIQADQCELGRLTANSSFGDVELRRTQGDLKVSLSAGDIRIAGQDSGSLDVRALSGDISADTAAGNVTLGSVSGDIEAVLRGPVSQASIDTKSGDVDCELADRDYTATIRCLSGDIRNRTGLASQMVSKHEAHIGQGRGSVAIRTLSGDISIR